MSENTDLVGMKRPKKNPGGTPVSIISQKIEIRPFNRTEQDIATWRSALRSAEGLMSYRVKLYDIYKDLRDDGHVEAVMGKRKDPVTTANYKFVDKAGKDVDEINQLIDSIGFGNMLEEIIEDLGWGYGMMEPSFYKNSDDEWEMSLYVVPKYLMRPELGIIAKNAYSDEGINIRQGIYAKTIMEVGKVDDLGLFNKAAPYYILKRGGIGDYAMFVQVFGNPLIDATWDGVDEGQRIKLSEALNAIGSGGAIIRPAGTDLKLQDKNSNANGDLQTKFLNFCNKEISKALLGSTETTEASESSGYAQSKTHEGQDDRKHESDIDYVRRVLNSRFIPILKAAGFDTRGGKFIVQGEEDELTMKESFEIHKGLIKEMGLPVDDDFLYETYKIPKPENYKEMKAKSEEAKQASPVPPPEGDKARAKGKPSTSAKATADKEEKVSLSFMERVKSFFVSALPEEKAGRALRQAQSRPLSMSSCGEILTLKFDEELDVAALCRAVQKADGKGYLYPAMFTNTAGPLTRAFKAGWDAIRQAHGDVLLSVGFEYGVDDPAMLRAFEVNLFKFSGVKSAYEAAQVNALFRQAKSFEEFERMVRKLYGPQNLNHLQAEYNTAYAVGESAATYNRLLGMMDTFPYWEYRTIGDDRVRETHRTLHGRVLPADHPLWAKIFPPNDWQCRCYVVPRLAGEVDEAKLQEDLAFVYEYVNSPYWQKVERAGFGINRGDALVVFEESQMYANNPDEVMRRIGGMTATQWGLLAMVDKSKGHGAKGKAPTTMDAGELSDYAGRKIVSSGFEGVKDVISKPDEVWISGNTWTYIRYYKDEVRRVEAFMNPDGTMEVIGSGLATEANRTGLLIL